MNKNRKLRFNAIDVLILLLIAAVIYVVLNVFVLNSDGSQNSSVNYKTIQYVVEVGNLDERFAQSVKAGQSVQDAIEKKVIGTVVGVQSEPYKKNNFSYDENKEVVSDVEGKITMKITIEAEAVDTESAYLVNNCQILVGKQFSLILPEMYAVGYCIDLSDNQ
mgnify:CR=1 FL=1